jgi:hypothetical protein
LFTAQFFHLFKQQLELPDLCFLELVELAEYGAVESLDLPFATVVDLMSRWLRRTGLGSASHERLRQSPERRRQSRLGDGWTDFIAKQCRKRNDSPNLRNFLSKLEQSTPSVQPIDSTDRICILAALCDWILNDCEKRQIPIGTDFVRKFG